MKTATPYDVEIRLEKHEAICAERYSAILETLRRIDERTEKHSENIAELRMKSSQYTGAWKTMIAVSIFISIGLGVFKFLEM